MASPTRESVLDERHRQLGCNLDGEMWNSMVMPWDYHTDPYVEIAVMRTWAGLYDVSGLYVKHVKGPDAEAVVDHLVTCDCTALKPGQAALGCELNDQGHIVDDIMISRDGPDHFRLTHGEGATPENLDASAEGRDVTIEDDNDTHILSLQGPRSLAILDAEADVNLADLKYFHHTPAKLFGKSVIIGRGGYSGELGYEIYCHAADALEIWDSILDSGEDEGVMPCSWNALDISRVEAGLLFFPFDMPEGDTTPWEINYGWSVSDKGDYRGKDAVMASKGKERFKQAGISVDHTEAMEVGDTIYKDGKEVGRVNSPTFSQHLVQSIALVHLAHEAADLGTALEVEHGGKRYPATVVRTPFYDPMRLRTNGLK
ncbi:aminomethyltransferase [Methylohalomonas lacus]|uniref:Aminomethyltransferase n=1 Tax=Methylohalomonas lacus TaxID=398773 RepID=A0AAE3L4N3_9GAMM|nr:aminomethyltransferase family protein [Methylohalomonas lacus]MCS3902022.1 aminomethyltransferase [Methylohalomonas lacus]